MGTGFITRSIFPARFRNAATGPSGFLLQPGADTSKKIIRAIFRPATSSRPSYDNDHVSSVGHREDSALAAPVDRPRDTQFERHPPRAGYGFHHAAHGGPGALDTLRVGPIALRNADPTSGNADP